MGLPTTDHQNSLHKTKTACSKQHISPRVFMIQGFHLLSAVPLGGGLDLHVLKTASRTDLPHLFSSITHIWVSKNLLPLYVNCRPPRPSRAVLETALLRTIQRQALRATRVLYATQHTLPSGHMLGLIRRVIIMYELLQILEILFFFLKLRLV